MLNSQKVNQTKCNVYIAHLYSDIFTCLWYMMICDDIWWYMMIYDEIWWYIMIYDDIWWYMMTYDDIWRKQKQQHTFCIYIYITILYETTIKNINFYICPMYIYIYIYIMYVFVLPVEVLATFIMSPRFPNTFGKMSGSWSIPGIKIIGYPIEVVN